jgi:hypothetical protein
LILGKLRGSEILADYIMIGDKNQVSFKNIECTVNLVVEDSRTEVYLTVFSVSSECSAVLTNEAPEQTAEHAEHAEE